MVIQRIPLNRPIDLHGILSILTSLQLTLAKWRIRLNSEGVLGVPNWAASSVVGSENLATQDEGNFAVEGLPVEPQPSTSYAGPRIPEQLSANRRAVLRKFIVKAEPVTIPMGQPTVAFTEPHLHAILRTISAETVQSSVHVMKALLMHAAQGGIQKLGHFRETVQRTDLLLNACMIVQKGRQILRGIPQMVIRVAPYPPMKKLPLLT